MSCQGVGGAGAGVSVYTQLENKVSLLLVSCQIVADCDRLFQMFEEGELQTCEM